MTLTELQRAGAKWSERPVVRWDNKEPWENYLAKERIRLAVEIAIREGVTLDQLAKELIDELA